MILQYERQLNLPDFCEEIEACNSKIIADTRFYLIFGIAGQDSEDHRNIIHDIEIHDPTRRFCTDIIEVRSISSDHYPDSDDQIIRICLDESFRKTWKLEGSWHSECIDIDESFFFEKFSIHSFDS